MSELIIDYHLRASKLGEDARAAARLPDLNLEHPDEDVRAVARARTLTALTRLDGERKRSVLQFLYESGLISKGRPADLLMKCATHGCRNDERDLGARTVPRWFSRGRSGLAANSRSWHASPPSSKFSSPIRTLFSGRSGRILLHPCDSHTSQG